MPEMADPGEASDPSAQSDCDGGRGKSPDGTQDPCTVCYVSDAEEDQQEVCRICHAGGSSGEPLLAPCRCSGSVKYVHETCLQRWLLRDVAEGGTLCLTTTAAVNRKCELCKTNYTLTCRLRPFREWRKLNMTCTEKRKVICSAVFHVIAVACVAWSLYVLIERAIEEVHESLVQGTASTGTADVLSALQWPFWTKLAVVVVGLVGASVFVYIQFKAYFILFVRWRSVNRVIHIKGQVLVRKSPSESPLLQRRQQQDLPDGGEASAGQPGEDAKLSQDSCC